MATPDAEAPMLCTMCDTSGVQRCSQCRSVRYCSSKCQRTDWPTHKLLCRSFSSYGVRPLPSLRRAILFPVDEKTPKFIWVEVTNREGWEMPNLAGALGAVTHARNSFHFNIRQQRDLSHTITIVYRDAFLKDGSVPNESIAEATGGTHEHPWAGPVVALRRDGTSFDPKIYTDITLGDFRDVVDYFISCHSEKCDEEGLLTGARKADGEATKKVKGVRISCEADQQVCGAEKYIPVEVSDRHSVFTSGLNSAVGISKLVEIPILVSRYRPDPAWKDDPAAADSNQEVTFLHLELNPKSATFGWAPREWSNCAGTVLAVRADRKALSPHHMEALCEFCLRKLQPVIEDSLGGGRVERTRDEVMLKMTRAKFEKYFENYKARQIAMGNDSWRCTPSPYAV